MSPVLPNLANPPYKRIYFDSNPLIRANWPDISQALLSTINLAGHFEITSVLLDVVERELAAHWKRDYRKTHNELIDKSKSLEKLAGRLGFELDLDLERPEVTDLGELYYQMVDNVVEGANLLRVKPQLRTSDELFEMAIHHKVPFKEQGRNFQDAVICLAAIDDLATTSEKTGAFITGDEIFDQSAVETLCKAAGVSLKLFKSLEALSANLSGLLSTAAQRQWENERKLAFQAVQSDIKTIEPFVEKNLEVPLSLGIVDRIVSLSRIEIDELVSVDTPVPWDIEPGEKVALSAAILVKIHAVVQRQILSPGALPVLRMGVAAKPFFTGVTNRQLSEILERSAIVEIGAKRTGNGYSNLEPTRVSLATVSFQRTHSLPETAPSGEGS